MYHLVKKILFRWDAERAHRFTFASLSRFPFMTRFMTKPLHARHELSQSLWGMTFPHPLGLAAGLDKNGEGVDAFLSMGFAFVEVGTVTPQPQPGNPKPRLFRLIEDEALINRMGFNNEGAAALLSRLERTQKKTGWIGVNLGKNKWTDNDAAVHDYTFLIEQMLPVADYFVINVSSPNTPGLRDLQSVDSLLPLVKSVQEKRDTVFESLADRTKIHHRPPVFVKLAPDLADEDISELTKRLQEIGVDGLIATNTTIRRPSLADGNQNETGGLSGKPLRERSTEVVRLAYKATSGQVPIIASGGVFSAEDAYEKICAGASLVQIYTALIYHGPQVVHDIVQGLSHCLKQDGLSTIDEAIGKDHR